MNCLEFRRICLSDPYASAADFAAHRRECHECTRFAESVTAFDKKLLDAMQVPVPDDLATRVKLRQVIGEEHERRVRPWQWALAASIFVTVALGGFFGLQVYATNQYIAQLQASVIDHVNSEPDFVSVQGKVPSDKFARVMAAFGAEVVNKDIEPLITHAYVCVMDNRPIAHIFAGTGGQVTVLYVTGAQIGGDTLIKDDSHQGVLIPAGSGNFAVIAPKGEPIEPLVTKLKQSIRWQI
jgi:hypothetical protein